MQLPKISLRLLGKKLNYLDNHVPTFIKTQRRLKFLKKALPTLAILLALSSLSLALWRFSKPRLKATSLVKLLLPQVEEAALSLGEVDRSLKDLYEFISGKELSYKEDIEPYLGTKTFAPLLEGVLGVSEKGRGGSPPLLKFKEKSLLLKKLLRELEKRENFGEVPQVLGTSLTELKEENPFKRQRNLASWCQEAVEKAVRSLLNLKITLSRERLAAAPPKSFHKVLSSLKETVSKSESYLAEAKRTADYYILISTVQEETSESLTSLLQTVEKVSQSERPYLYLKKLARLKRDFESSLQKLKEVKEANLPFGFLAIHADNLKILSLLSQSTENIALSIKNNDFKLLKETMDNLSLALEETAEEASRLESGFWENNKNIWLNDLLKKHYEKIEEDLKDLYQKNRLPAQRSLNHP